MSKAAEIVRPTDWINPERAANPHSLGGMDKARVGIVCWPYADDRIKADARMMRLWHEYAKTRQLAGIPEGWPANEAGAGIAAQHGAFNLWHLLAGASLSGEYKTPDRRGKRHKFFYEGHQTLMRYKAFASARQALRRAIAKQFNP